MFTLSLNAIAEVKPVAVKRVPSQIKDETKFIPEELTGKWLRVFPQTGRDVQFLRLTEMHLDRFAPAVGHGVLLAARCLP